MNVHIFDVDKVFLDICTTSGQGAGTAVVIFGKMDAVLSQHGTPWKKLCLSGQYVGQYVSTTFPMF